MRTRTYAIALGFALGAAGVACGFSDSTFAASADGSADGGASADSGGALGDSGPIENGIILVHASKTPAFRLCFDNDATLMPQPDSKVMPSSNVVGVEVGAAVRINPLSGPPGKVFLFDEFAIRQSYGPFGSSGPTCAQLFASTSFAKLAVPLGTVTTDLSKGVHVLVVTGCPASVPARTYTNAECGGDYDPALGNLRVLEQTLSGSTAASPGKLSVQVVQLSAALDFAVGKEDLSLTFGDLAGATDKQELVSALPPLFAAPLPDVPARVGYESADAGIYENTGFRVSIASGDSGSSTLFQKSLAQIQKESASQDLPTTYYAAASNCVLMVLGEPAPKLTDGGVDTDERHTLHLIAVPVVEPKPSADGGADGGT